MKTLITPSQALRVAFAADGYLPPDILSEDDIAAAEERYIVPVIGRTLHEKLLAGSYAEFTAAHLATPAALFTRIVIQPRLDLLTGRGGTTSPEGDGVRTAERTACRERMQALRTEARTLLRRAARHLADHVAEFPEYDPANDILNRCSLDGNLVQTR